MALSDYIGHEGIHLTAMVCIAAVCLAAVVFKPLEGSDLFALIMAGTTAISALAGYQIGKNGNGSQSS